MICLGANVHMGRERAARVRVSRMYMRMYALVTGVLRELALNVQANVPTGSTCVRGEAMYRWMYARHGRELREFVNLECTGECTHWI